MIRKISARNINEIFALPIALLNAANGREVYDKKYKKQIFHRICFFDAKLDKKGSYCTGVQKLCKKRKLLYCNTKTIENAAFVYFF